MPKKKKYESRRENRTLNTPKAHAVASDCAPRANGHQGPQSSINAQRGRKVDRELITQHQTPLTGQEMPEENELLLLQLHQIQEELEYYVLNSNANGHHQPGNGDVTNCFEAGILRFGHAEDRTPHRHLEFDLEGVRISDQTIGCLQVRLVEHHGRAGMLVRAAADDSHPMELWREDGREGEHAFLLVVPQDDQGKSFIGEAKARDLILLRQAALLAAAHLSQESTLQSTLSTSFWRSVALRFVAFLDEATDRLCPGKAHIERGTHPGFFSFKIEPVLIAGRVLSALQGSWNTEYLTLELPGDGHPPLIAWPRNKDGSFAKFLKVPLTRAAADELATLRMTLPRADRQTLGQILKGLPDVLVQQPLVSSRGDAATRAEPIPMRPEVFRKAADDLLGNRRGAFLFNFFRNN